MPGNLHGHRFRHPGVIHRTLVARWKQQLLTEVQLHAAWNDYVPKHLLPRLHGYELMMAPYAIAHMKIGLKLYETGYRFGSDERARIYLTNALEPPSDEKKQREFEQWAPALAHEAQAVNAIKTGHNFTVVIGNPPYSRHSQNNEIPSIVNLVHDYKKGIPALQKPAQAKALQDDYVKFIRFAQWRLSKSGLGVLGFVTSHSFLDNPTFLGMRKSLISTFSKAYVLDLHGNAKKKETCADGSVDKNVFDIQQGVAGLTPFYVPVLMRVGWCCD